MHKSSPNPAPPAEVHPSVLYSVADLRRRLRLGWRAWQSLLRAGLQPIRLGNRTFVRGERLIEAIERAAEDKAA